MAEYVSKNEVKPYRKIFDKMMADIRESVRKKGITFTYQLVGSAKRNLVVRHHNKGFDCDYQIVIHKNKNNCTATEIKRLFGQLLNKVRRDDFSDVQDSTSAWTMRKTDSENSRLIFSYDIVILRQDKNGVHIIRQDKRNKEEGYFWNPLPDMNSADPGISAIKGAQKWNELRKVYLQKKTEKIEQGKYKDKASFQLLNEAINEVIKADRQ